MIRSLAGYGTLLFGCLCASLLPGGDRIVIDKTLVQEWDHGRTYTDMTPCQQQEGCPLKDDRDAALIPEGKTDERGDDYFYKGGCDKGLCGKGCGCGRAGGLTLEVELMFLKYGQEGGVTDVVGSPASFAFEFAPRIALGYELASGLGLRSRYWQYDHGSVSSAGNPVHVDAYTVDLELYDSVDLTRRFDLEGAVGVRAAGFSQDATDLAIPTAVASSWDGFGGTLALKARRHCRLGSLYARGHCSALMGDASVANIVGAQPSVSAFEANDNVVYQAEIGFGYEVSRQLGWLGVLDARAGVEWQNWTSVAISDTQFGGIGNDDVLEDGGFAGFAFGVGLRR